MPFSIPRSFDDVTPAWLNSILQPTGCLGIHRIFACNVEQVGADFGFASQVARVHLTYDSPECPGPPSLIAKLPATSSDCETSAKLWVKCVREARFYSQIAQDAGITVPHCYHVACEDNGDRFVLLLEDLIDGKFGDCAVGCSTNEAELVVDSLAAFHASWWNSAKLKRLAWLPPIRSGGVQIAKLQDRRDSVLERFHCSVPHDVQVMTRQVDTQHVRLLESLQGPPETLLHVDTHLDNVAFAGAGDDIRLILFDWQGVSKGLSVVDLAHFVTGTSSKATRLNEEFLLKRYHQGLISGGVDAYSFDRFFQDYRIAILRWWIGTVNGLGNPDSRNWTGRQADVAHQGVERWAAAALSYGVPALVKQSHER